MCWSRRQITIISNKTNGVQNTLSPITLALVRVILKSAMETLLKVNMNEKRSYLTRLYKNLNKT